MRRIDIAALVGVASLATSALPAMAEAPATAAAPSQAAAAAPDAQARKVALVRRYFQAVRFERTMNVSMNAVLPVLLAEEAKSHPRLPPEVMRTLAQTLQESMSAFLPKMIDRFSQVYADVLTEEELMRMVEFYESPVGQSITGKTAQLAALSGPLTRELIPELRADMLARLCAKIDCKKSGLKPSGKTAT